MCKYGTVLLLVFLFVGWIIGVWTFLGKGLTQHKSSDLSHSNPLSHKRTHWTVLYCHFFSQETSKLGRKKCSYCESMLFTWDIVNAAGESRTEDFGTMERAIMSCNWFYIQIMVCYEIHHLRNRKICILKDQRIILTHFHWKNNRISKNSMVTFISQISF